MSLIEKKNFIYSVDKTFRGIRVIDLNRTEPTYYSTDFLQRQFRLIKFSFSIHSTAAYIHPRLDSRIGPRFSDWANHRADVQSTRANL